MRLCAAEVKFEWEHEWESELTPQWARQTDTITAATTKKNRVKRNVCCSVTGTMFFHPDNSAKWAEQRRCLRNEFLHIKILTSYVRKMFFFSWLQFFIKIWYEMYASQPLNPKHFQFRLHTYCTGGRCTRVSFKFGFDSVIQKISTSFVRHSAPPFPIFHCSIDAYTYHFVMPLNLKVIFISFVHFWGQN